LSPRIKQLVDKLPLTINFENRQWFVTRDEFLRWLDFKKDGENITFELRSEELFKFLNIIRKGVDQKPIDAKFKIENGKVVEFQGSHNGRIIDYEKTSTLITNALMDETLEKLKTIDVASIVLEPRITTANVNNVGIAEIIGIGRSNFKGSPQNRIHNIKTGAAAVNGTLIAPNEEFSLLKILGKVNGEMVICRNWSSRGIKPPKNSVADYAKSAPRFSAVLWPVAYQLQNDRIIPIA